jgi:UDP-N-acetylmuramate dehydrogenase
MQIQKNVPLAPFTTLGVGGPAQFFVEALSTAEVLEAVAFAESRNAPLFVLGGGSNLVVSDAGWPGLVLKVSIQGINHRHGHGSAYFDAGAGESWDDFVAIVVQHHCAGVECLSGIPGSVGGTPVQNVGAYGQEVSETITTVVALDLQTGREEEFDKEDCGFGYRTSMFNTSGRGRYVILRVTFALVHDGAPRIVYGDLKKYFAGVERKPTVAEVRGRCWKSRASKATLIRPGDGDSKKPDRFSRTRFSRQWSSRCFSQRPRREGSKFLVIPRCIAQKPCGLASGALRVLQRLQQRPCRNFAKACARNRESRRRYCC